MDEVLMQPDNDEDLESPIDDLPTGLPLTAELGAILFVATKPLSTERLAVLLRARSRIEEVETALLELADSLKSDVHGFSLVEVNGGWEIRTDPAAKSVIQRMIPPKAKRLSRAASETLAIIAYKQPVQKAEIESIRGVDAAPTLKTLLDARIIRIVGHDNAPGHPALYGTTNIFLEKFGLNDLGDLPTISEIQDLIEEPGEVDVN